MRQKNFYFKVMVLLAVGGIVGNFLFTLWFPPFAVEKVQATAAEEEEIIDIDIALGSGEASLALTRSGKLYVVGKENYGIFGDGDLEDNAYTEYTQVPLVLDPGDYIIDIVSQEFTTYILTNQGFLYRAGIIHPTWTAQTTFEKIDPAYFSGSIKKIIRNYVWTTILDSNDKLYVTPSSHASHDGEFREINLPSHNGSDPVTVKQTMPGNYGSGFLLLDTVGQVWRAINWHNFGDGTDPAVNWQKVTLDDDTTVVPIKQMIIVFRVFFISEDNRLLYGNSDYIDEGGNSLPFLTENQMGYTDITGVDSFFPIFAPTTSPYPNLKMLNGEIWMGDDNLLRKIVGDTVGVPTGQNYTNAGAYFPEILNASAISLSQPWNDPSSGSILINNKLIALNGDEYYTNGVFNDPGDPLTPVLLTPMKFYKDPFVINPNAITLDQNINPSSAILGPAQQDNIPVQANWWIMDRNNTVVRSGKITLETSTGSLNIANLNLSMGNYVLHFFRETAPSYPGTYMRSENNASIPFSIQYSGGNVTVQHLDQNGNPIALEQVLQGNIGDAFTTTPVVVNGYTLLTPPTNPNGLFTANAQVITYIYTATTEPTPTPSPEVGGDVSIYFEDEAGNQLESPIVLKGNVGESFASSPKAVPNYILIQTPSNASGVFTSLPQTVKYVYRIDPSIKPIQAGDVTANYLDEAGKKISDATIIKGNVGAPFKVEAKKIANYTLIATPNNVSGLFTVEPQTVNFVYKSTPGTPGVTTPPKTGETGVMGSIVAAIILLGSGIGIFIILKKRSDKRDKNP